jgi:GH43 family beta-xylosidase
VRAVAYRNPVHAGYLADPFVWAADGEYLAIGTGAAEAACTPHEGAGATVFPLLRSADLVHWEPLGHALVRPHAALGNAFWAPEVAHHAGRWFLYYSVGHGERAHQLRVASSRDARGPYVDVAALTDPRAVPFAIDPHPFRDAEGAWHLFHARDFLDDRDEHGRTVRQGTALVVHRLHDMTRLDAAGVTVARARRDWQRFRRDREMYGTRRDWHTLEGPCVLRHDGRYFCLYSGGCWQYESYGVDYVSADRIEGPWHDDGIEAGPRVLRTVPGRVLGPGHCSIVPGIEESTPVLVYHAWDAARTARRMCIDALALTSQGPRCAGPSSTEQRLQVRALDGA